MKKVLSILLVMLMIFPVMSVSAAEETKINDMIYTIPENFVCIDEGELGYGYMNTKYEYEAAVVKSELSAERENYQFMDEVPEEVATVMGGVLTEKFKTLSAEVGEQVSENKYSFRWLDTAENKKFFVTIITFDVETPDGEIVNMYAFSAYTIYDYNFYTVYNLGDANECDLDAILDMIYNIRFVDAEETPAEPADDTIKILIDGERIYPDSDPVIVDGRTLCPIRAVAEKLGYNVGWDNDLRKATIENSERKLEFVIGATQMAGMEMLYGPNGLPVQHGFSKALDVPAQIINNRTYLPLRAVGEALDCEVDWDGNTRTVIITTKK